MFRKLFQIFTLRCRHNRMTQPFTTATPEDYSRTTDWQPVSTTTSMSHYVVCLDCGRKFGYDWSQMRTIWH
jgi:hypothetical protein